MSRTVLLLLALLCGFLLGRILREKPLPAAPAPSSVPLPSAGPAPPAPSATEVARLLEENRALRAREGILEAIAIAPAASTATALEGPFVDRFASPVRVAGDAGDPKTGTLRAVCTGPEGGPAGGIHVSAHRTWGEPTVLPTDDGGIAEFRGLAPGAYFVGPALEGGGQSLSVAVRPGRAMEASFTIEPCSVVEGRVAHAVRGPLEGIRVTLLRIGGIGTATLGAKTDAEGRYRFEGVPAGRWEMRLQGEAVGFTRQAWAEIAVEAGRPLAKDILVGAKGLSGTVRDRATGRPIPGVSVRVHQGGPFRMVGADSEGRYRIADLAPGTYGIGFFLDGYAEEIVGGVAVAAGGRELDAEMTPAGTLVLLVTDAGGRPVTGKLDLSWGRRDAGGPLTWSTTVPADGAGRVVFRRLAPGGYRMEVGASGLAARTIEFELPPGEITLEVRLERPR